MLTLSLDRLAVSASFCALLFACACSNSSSSGASPDDASGGTSAAGGGSATGGANAAGGSSNGGISCALAPAAEVGSTLGAGTLEAAVETDSAPVYECAYSDGSNPDRVLIRFETGYTMDEFTMSRAAFDAHGEPTTDVSGIGDSAYSSTIGSGVGAVNTIVVLKGSTDVEITSTDELTKLEALAAQILPSL